MLLPLSPAAAAVILGIIKGIGRAQFVPLQSIEQQSFVCYECTGRNGDNGCGTPFRAKGLNTCNGTACMVTRKLVDVDRGTIIEV
jgi:hypothetical protein